MSAAAFIKLLKTYKRDRVFNPYAELCPLNDRHNADQIRRGNLAAVIRQLKHVEVDALWIGRDLGYRGGRRTGLPFTDDTHLAIAESFWGTKLRQPTKGELITERSGSNIWSQLRRTQKNILTWNVFPFHPYNEGDPLSNRSHNAKEREEGLVILESLIALLNPAELIAIGNDAHRGCLRVFDQRRVKQVRHPSYGGEVIFRKQVAEHYQL